MRTPKIWVAIVVSGPVAMMAACVMSQSALAQSGPSDWLTPVDLAPADTPAGQGMIAADSGGDLHAMWSSHPLLKETESEVIYYSRNHDGNWSQPLDVIAPAFGGGAKLIDIAVDGEGVLHAVFLGAPKTLVHVAAHVAMAANASSWSAPEVLYGDLVYSTTAADLLVGSDGQLNVYLAAEDKGVVLHTRLGSDGEWSEANTVGASVDMDEVTIAVRAAESRPGNLHVVWSTAPAQGAWPGRRVLYSHSNDGGATWDDTIELDSVDSGEYSQGYGPLYASTVSGGDGLVHVLWDGPPAGQRQHMYSMDDGRTWSSPVPVLGELRGITQFNDLGVDSNGTVHLVTGGFLPNGDTLAYYSHFEHGVWLPPYPLRTDIKTEAPRLAIANGNRLAVVGWFIAEGRVWFTEATSSAPTVEAVPVRNPVATGSASPWAPRTVSAVTQPTLTGGSEQLSYDSGAPLIPMGGAPGLLAVVAGAIAAAAVVVTAMVVVHNRSR